MKINNFLNYIETKLVEVIHDTRHQYQPQPLQHIQPQRRPDFIHSQRDRETLPKTTFWQDIQDWSYMPIELQINGKDVYVDKMSVIMLTGAVLGYIGLALYLRKFFK